MSYEITQERFSVSARQVCAPNLEKINKALKENPTLALAMLNCSMDEASAQVIRHAQDSLYPSINQSSISTPLQFLQNFAPGNVLAITAVRKGDEAIGYSAVGRWEDEQIVQQRLELLGTAQPYGDYANLPLTSWLNGFEVRTVVRFKLGYEVTQLEQKRAAAANQDSGANKRNAVTNELEIVRNNVAFNGYNNGLNKTYGIFNDPGLPGYITVATGASGDTTWASKTTLEIIADIQAMVAALEVNSQGNIDGNKTPITMLIPTVNNQRLNTPTELGYSVTEWINKNYPQMRIVAAPELAGANGGDNVTYMYAERMNDGSTDDHKVWLQAVPTKFQLLGVEQKIDLFREGYTNATAGVMLKRPFALYRVTGV